MYIAQKNVKSQDNFKVARIIIGTCSYKARSKNKASWNDHLSYPGFW